jgi:hypothetical protein
MSLWIYKKDKNGKTILWQIDIAIPLIMVLLGLLAALIGPKALGNPSFMVWLPFALAVAGFVLLLISKVSLYRKGIWSSFGSRQMSKKYASIYKAAYVLLGLGVLLLLLIWNALRRA